MASPEQGWSKLYDGWNHHPKFVEAGPLAAAVYFAGQQYCNSQETDGLIPKKVVPGFFPGAISTRKLQQTCKILVAARLWEELETAWKQHNYCKMQRTTADKEAVRAQGRERQRRFRENGNVTRDKSVSNALVTEQSSVVESRGTDVPPSSEGGSPDSEGPQEDQDHSNPEGPDHSAERARGPVDPTEGPKAPRARGSYDETNPFHDGIMDLAEDFWGHPDHPTPEGPAAIAKALNEVRLILAKDMKDTPTDQRVERLCGILKAAEVDDFWSRQIRSLAGLRNVSKRNSLRKWMNAESGLKDGGPRSGERRTSLPIRPQHDRNMEVY